MSNPGISLTAPDDPLLLQAQAQRQQQLAQALNQMGEAPIQAQSAGGITAPISPLSVLAKALNSFGGTYESGQALQSQLGAQQAYRQQAQDWLAQTMQPSQTVAPQAPQMAAPQVQGPNVQALPGGAPQQGAQAQLSAPQMQMPAPIAPTPPSYGDIWKSAMQGMAMNNPIIDKIAPEVIAANKPIMGFGQPGEVPTSINPITQQVTVGAPIGGMAQIIPRSDWAKYGIDPNNVPPGDQFFLKPGSSIPVEEKYGDVKSPGAQAQAINQAVAQRTAINNIGMPPAGGPIPGVTGDPIPHPEKQGYATVPVPNSGGLTQAAIDQAAMNFALTGQMPSMGMGSTGIAGLRRTAIQNRAGEMNAGGNIQANKAQVMAIDTALKNNVNQGTQIATNLANATNEGNQVISAFNGKINNSVPLVNVLKNAAQYNLDPKTVSAYRASLADLAATYSQVFGRGGVVTDQVRSMAKDIADGNISVSALQNVLNQVNTQGQIIVKGYESKRQELQGQYGNILTGQTPTVSAPAPGGTVPITKIIGGVTYTSPDGGKTWFQ
jgi:hypothetical protein